MNVVVSDPKTRKAYTVKADDDVFAGKKIGEEIDLGRIGAAGFAARITGGSDKNGFPMRSDLPGTARRKILITKSKKNGVRKRITRRGNTVDKDIHQLNMVLAKEGQGKIEELLNVEKKQEEISEKDKVLKEVKEVPAAETEKKEEAPTEKEKKVEEPKAESAPHGEKNNAEEPKREEDKKE